MFPSENINVKQKNMHRLLKHEETAAPVPSLSLCLSEEMLKIKIKTRIV